MKFKATHLSSKTSFTKSFYYSAMFLFLTTNFVCGDNTHLPDGITNSDDHPSSTRVKTLIKTFETKPALAVRTTDPLPITEPCPTQPPAPLPVAKLEPQSVVKLDVLPRPIPIVKKQAVQPIDEPCPISSQQAMAPQEGILFSEVFEEKAPLAILDANQDPQMQQWVLFASASRGVKKGVVEIVEIYGTKGPSSRGKDVQALLIQMGIPPEQLHVIYAKDENLSNGKVYLFVKEKGR